MDRAAYDSLTPMERNCLRLARHDRKTEQIAHRLGIATSTVNTHIFSARRKLGGVSRLTAGDQLRLFEKGIEAAATADLEGPRPDPSTQDPAARPAVPSQQPISRSPQSIGGPLPGDAGLKAPTEVREERATFVFDDVASTSGGQERQDAALRRALTLLAIAALTALVLIAAPAIYDSTAQRIANSLERPHAR